MKMKYWTQLNELESAIYEVKSIQAGLNILCETELFTCYSPEGITQSHQTFVIDLNERFNTAMEKLNERFQNTWDAVRDDTWDAVRDNDVNDEDAFGAEDDLAAIDDFEEDQATSVRFEGILADLPTMNFQTSGAIDDLGITVTDEQSNVDFTMDLDVRSNR